MVPVFFCACFFLTTRQNKKRTDEANPHLLHDIRTPRPLSTIDLGSSSNSESHAARPEQSAGSTVVNASVKVYICAYAKKEKQVVSLNLEKPQSQISKERERERERQKKTYHTD